MPKPQNRSKTKTEDQLLDQATNQLLRAIKQHTAAKGQPLDRGVLLKDGYSERFVAKVEKA